MKTETDNQPTLRQYVTDMRALDQYVLDLAKVQAADDNVKKYPQASRIINQIVFVTQKHIEGLESQITRLEAEPRATVKDTVTAMITAVMGLVNKVRSHDVSKMLRDDYTVLSLAAISYTMLHTTGLALGDSLVANLALNHLRNITPLVIELSQIIPSVVTTELAEEGDSVDLTAAASALNNSQQAWRQNYVSTM